MAYPVILIGTVQEVCSQRLPLKLRGALRRLGTGVPAIETRHLRAGFGAVTDAAETGVSRRDGPVAPVKTGEVLIEELLAQVIRRGQLGAAVVVGIPARTLSVVALASEDAQEGLLKLPVVRRINDRVQAAVEVAQPEDHFEQRFWWS